MDELLTPLQMGQADELTIAGGYPGIELMENAGRAVVETFHKNYPAAQNLLIVCGTGNNGGDGFIAARLLLAAGKKIALYICGDPGAISGDAGLALEKIDQKMLLNDKPDFTSYDVIIDALLGAGLDRDVEGAFAEIIESINASGKPVLAVDLPSGIDGRTGLLKGHAIKANCTATFFRYKPGHLLQPGRYHCGSIALHQIGIQETVLEKTGNIGLRNSVDCWLNHYPFPIIDGHKYDRGHTLVLSGPVIATGAARLAAQAALRSGSGLVTVATPTEALAVNAGHLTSIMLQTADSLKQVQKILTDPRLNCVVLGPGLPANKKTRNMVLKILRMGRITVLDAGALSAFAGKETALFSAIKSAAADVFLTPHEGEFSRLFSNSVISDSKIDRAIAAAKISGATIVLKGSDTVVATHDGQVSVCDNAPPWLASAGSGDVLAGIIAGFAAQGMPAFEAASAAVWMHGEAANISGIGMVSSDLDAGLKLAIENLARLHQM